MDLRLKREWLIEYIEFPADTIRDKIEELIVEVLEIHRFTPNDAYIRRSVIHTIYQRLNDLRAHRKIRNFEIICDDRNNPPSIVDSNQIAVNVRYIESFGIAYDSIHKIFQK